jgi:riboflavin synthase
MFTGIIEQTAELFGLQTSGSNTTFTFTAELAAELKVDQSLSHNGVCLTVESVENKTYTVTAIAETLRKTNLGDLKLGDKVNLERCMLANGRFDGHIVQGHVDQTGVCTQIIDQNGSFDLYFRFDSTLGNIVVEKGSICVNGVSLTVVNAENESFSVSIIPYTWQHTNLSHLKVGQSVNLEFDIIGKYMKRLLAK